jgi:hypothetical protein
MNTNNGKKVKYALTSISNFMDLLMILQLHNCHTYPSRCESLHCSGMGVINVNTIDQLIRFLTGFRKDTAGDCVSILHFELLSTDALGRRIDSST